MKQDLRFTVHCFTDRSARRHFSCLKMATDYANELLRQGHKCKIYPYKSMRYIDLVAKRGING